MRPIIIFKIVEIKPAANTADKICNKPKFKFRSRCEYSGRKKRNAAVIKNAAPNAATKNLKLTIIDNNRVHSPSNWRRNSNKGLSSQNTPIMHNSIMATENAPKFFQLIFREAMIKNISVFLGLFVLGEKFSVVFDRFRIRLEFGGAFVIFFGARKIPHPPIA